MANGPGGILNFDSPGILLREIDESVIPNEAVTDGPIIIGRARKGPGMEPIRVRSLDAFISVFGKPVAGGPNPGGDIWRDGPNLNAPTYGAYAAQAWLASGNSPCKIGEVCWSAIVLTPNQLNLVECHLVIQAHTAHSVCYLVSKNLAQT